MVDRVHPSDHPTERIQRMLIIARMPEESIRCTLPDGQTIEIKVVEIRSNGAKVRGKVKLGIASPETVIINRVELEDRTETGDGKPKCFSKKHSGKLGHPSKAS